MDNEQAYLVDSLQRQQQRVRKLTDGMLHIEERLATIAIEEGNSGAGLRRLGTASACGGAGGGERRKLRKDASLLRSRIVAAERQESLVLGRLNDIGIQKGGQEPMQCYFAPQPFFVFPLSPHLLYQVPIQYLEPMRTILPPIHTTFSQQSILASSLLSPLSPAFVPGVMFSDSFSWNANEHRDATTTNAAKPADQLSPTDMSGLETSEVDKIEGEEEDGEEEIGDYSWKRGRSAFVGPISPMDAPTHHKRMSLPAVRSMWSELPVVGCVGKSS